ncbi:A type inclusion protein [Volepox virus]|uniref:A type inclusion protein n=1 Tax=Volepox virus TaxID=28874 RepID=A0A1C9KCF7_9POXV|nr:A type inclusion protein [Volepox virus]AOP31834.1 A type inclusion protein [Volepox virus]
MEVTNLIEKCTQHSKAFASEVEKLWNDELNFYSGLSRKTRNIIRNILRDITKSLTTNKKKKCFQILESSTINGISIKDAYKTIFNKGVDVASKVDTTGKYVLFMVMTYAAAELRLVKPKEIVAVLSRLFSTICDIHSKYECGNMFVGIPAALINPLDIDHINQLFTVFSKRYDVKAHVYNEFFIFLNMNYHFQEDDNIINVEYGPVSLTSSISVPDYVMEALTFKSCDRIIKSEDLKFVYVFTKKVKDLNNTTSDSIFSYVRLVDTSYDDGVSEDTDDEDEVFAILNCNINSVMDRYRNRVLLLTPEIVVLRQHENLSDAYPDYRYLIDEEVPVYDKNLPKPITHMESLNQNTEVVNEEPVEPRILQSTQSDTDHINPLEDKNYVPILTKTALAIADYQLVINKLVEWLDKCEEKCEEKCENGGDEFKTKLEEAKKKINAMNSEINDKISKITSLERDSKYKTERIESLTKEIKHLRDMQNGSNDGTDPDIDKKTIKELRETIDKEREMRRELEKELDTVRGGKTDGSCQRELELSRMWLRQRDDDLRVEIDKRRNVEWELSRLRRDISECEQCTTELNNAKETINKYTIRISTLESEISKYQQTSETLSKVRRELEDEKRRVRDLESRLDECKRSQQDTQEIDYLNSRIRELETKLADCMESSGGDSSEINKLRAKITDLERRLNECKRNNETSPDEKEMERLRNRIMDLDRQLNECKRNGGGSSSDEVDMLKNRIKDLERSLEICSKDESELYSEYKNELERTRNQVSELRESLRKERESDKNDSYYKRELTRERNKIVELEKELSKCFDNNHDKYIDEINSNKIQISELEKQLEDCKSNGGGNNGSMDQYKREIEYLKRELEDCRRDNGGGTSSECKYFDEEAREEIKRLRKELSQLHEDLKRARESDKNDSYYKRELERQRAKVVELEKELERYFEDRRLEECKKHGDEMMRKISDLEKKLRDCGGNSNSNCDNGSSSNCEFERKRIAVLEAELRRCMDTIKVLEKFIEFDRLQKDYNDKLEIERERRMKAENDLEREIARKNCGGNPCERELESERNKLKKMEYQLDAEKEKVKFYKRELERDRYLSKCNLSSVPPVPNRPSPVDPKPDVNTIPLDFDLLEDPEEPAPDTESQLTIVRDTKPEDPQISEPESQVPVVTDRDVKLEHSSSGSQVLVTPRLPETTSKPTDASHSESYTDLDNYLLD